MQYASGRAEERPGRLHTRISAENRPEKSPFSYSEVLGRRVRTGDWEGQTVSTLDKIKSSLDTRVFVAAAELGDVDDEAAVIHSSYRDYLERRMPLR